MCFMIMGREPAGKRVAVIRCRAVRSRSCPKPLTAASLPCRADALLTIHSAAGVQSPLIGGVCRGCSARYSRAGFWPNGKWGVPCISRRLCRFERKLCAIHATVRYVMARE